MTNNRRQALKRSLFGLSTVITIALAGCTNTSAPSPTATPPAPTSTGVQVGKPVTISGGSYTNVTPVELKSMLDKKDFPFINVHIPFEGNIANTDLSIPYNEIDRNLDKLPADKNAKIALYCRSGRMSTEATQTLVKLGYTNVWHLDGGMIAWQQAGYSLESR